MGVNTVPGRQPFLLGRTNRRFKNTSGVEPAIHEDFGAQGSCHAIETGQLQPVLLAIPVGRLPQPIEETALAGRSPDSRRIVCGEQIQLPAEASRALSKLMI